MEKEKLKKEDEARFFSNLIASFLSGYFTSKISNSLWGGNLSVHPRSKANLLLPLSLQNDNRFINAVYLGVIFHKLRKAGKPLEENVSPTNAITHLEELSRQLYPNLKSETFLASKFKVTLPELENDTAHKAPQDNSIQHKNNLFKLQ